MRREKKLFRIKYASTQYSLISIKIKFDFDFGEGEKLQGKHFRFILFMENFAEFYMCR